MLKISKIVLAIITVLLAIGAIGIIVVKDASAGPSYCARCHTEPYYTSWESADYLSGQHAHSGIPCQTCHPRTLGETLQEIAAQVTGDYEPLIMDLAPLDACLQCHEHDSYEEIIPLTERVDWERNPHASHWGEMECNVCHLMHRDSVDYCSKCHDPLVGGIEPHWVTLEKD